MSTHYMLGHHSKSPSQKFRPNELGSMNLNLSLFFILRYLGLNTHMYMSRNRNEKKNIYIYIYNKKLRKSHFYHQKKKKKKTQFDRRKTFERHYFRPSGWMEIHLIGIKSFFDVGAIL